jgi:hypothetical protein
LVIHGQNRGTALDHPLAMDDLKAEESRAAKREKV